MADFVTVGSSGAFQLESAANYSLRTTHEGGQTVYYSTSPRVSSTINDGSLTTGLSFTFTGRRFFITQSGTGTQGSSASLRLDNVPVLGESVPTPISFSVTTYGGADSTGVVDATSAIQSTINACAGAGGGIVFFPAGTYKCLGGLTVPRNLPVHLIGTGSNSSTLNFPNDLGAGVYAIGSTGSEAGMRHRFEDFFVQGPNPGAAVGVVPAAMKGIFSGSNNRFTRVHCNGTTAGVDLQGDHTHFYDCDLGGYYGLLFGDLGVAITARGNSVVQGCDFSGATYASLAVTTANAIEGGTFVNTHFGFAPYGIACVDQPAARTAPTSVNSCTFLDCAFEAIGNAVIYSNAGAGYGWVSGNRFIGCGTSVRNASYATGASTAYAVDVEHFDDNLIDGNSAGAGSGSFLCQPFDTGTIRATGSISRLEWRCADGALTSANSTGKPLFTGDGDGSMSTSRVQCGLFRANATLVQGDLTDAHSSIGLVNKSAAGIPVGVAATAGVVNNLLPVAIGGQVSAKVDVGTANLAYLKPSATAGKLTTALVTDQPRVGWSASAESGGFATVRLCPPATWAN